jgi:cysteine-rich repeat protein
MMRSLRTVWLLLSFPAALGFGACTIDFDQWTVAGAPVCGDSFVDPGEACDEGGLETATCNSDCTAPSCGDGVLRDPEQCDDGNAVASDGCTADCLFGTFYIAQDVGRDANLAYLHRPGVGLVGAGENERFLVAWPEMPAGAESRRIMVREFDLTGVAIANAQQVSTGTEDTACADIATNSDGRAVVVWADVRTGETTLWETMYAVVEPDGTVGSPRNIEGVPMRTFLGCPKVAATSTGDFCMVMQEKPDELTPPTMHVHCLDPEGADKGHPPNLSETHAGGSGRQWGQHAIVGYEDGFIALYFDSFDIDPDPTKAVYPIVAARLDADGNTAGNLLTVSTAAGDYIGSAFHPGGDESFILSYGAIEQSVERYMFELFETYQETSLLEQPASTVAQNEFGGKLVGASNGHFVAIWSGFPAGSTLCDLYYRAFTPAGVAEGEPVLLEESPAEECGQGAAGVVASNGNAMFVWDLKTADTTDLDIQGRVIAGLF